MGSRTGLLTVAAIVAGTIAVRESAATATSPPDDYRATIARDAFGVAHITADEWGSLGFGQGYAMAEDRSCTILDQIVKVRGERARWHGPGENDEHLDSDFAYRHLGIWEEAPQRWDDQPQRVAELVGGFVAGFNAEVTRHGGGSWCAGEAWVAPITTQDLYAYIADVLLLASSQNFLTEIATAQPPAATGDEADTVAAEATEPVGFSPPGASNAWAFGADTSTTGGGMLLGNPHFPWEGERRFWENHLTIPGELDVYGMALTGLPGVQIGFNDAVAWSHTVSSGYRFTLYRYDLDAADPTVYLVDGEPREMAPNEISVEVAGDDGTTTEVTRTLWSTHHGPVINLGPLPWSAEQAIAIRDANAEITTVLEQFLGMDAATSLDEFQQVHADATGVPWVNTIAAGSDGRAWYADTAATPNLSPEALAAWEAEVAADGLIGLAYNDFGVVLLDGSDSMFEWADDPRAPAPGLVPFDAMPQIERADYVFNANDSFWLSNPNEPLTGFSPLHGRQDVPQSPRTRTNILLLEERAEPWSIDDVQATLFAERSALAELLREPLVEACTATTTVEVDGSTVDLAEACAVLAAWDGTFTLESRGSIIFREWLTRFDFNDRVDQGRLFADPFDPADPGATPATPVDDRADWLHELGAVVQLLTFVGIPLDAPLGDWQFEVRTGDRLPMRGGSNVEGLANIVGCCSETSSLGPIPDNGEPITEELRNLGDQAGYAISRGSSFVMTVQYGPDGTEAEGFLIYGNPDDPTDPAYRAGLEAWSVGEWRPFLFSPDDVAAADLEVTEVAG